MGTDVGIADFFVLGAVLFLACGAGFYWLARTGRGGLVTAGLAALAAANLWMLYQSDTAGGWDGLEQFMYFLFFALPALAGAGLGALLGGRRRSK